MVDAAEDHVNSRHEPQPDGARRRLNRAGRATRTGRRGLAPGRPHAATPARCQAERIRLSPAGCSRSAAKGWHGYDRGAAARSGQTGPGALPSLAAARRRRRRPARFRTHLLRLALATGLPLVALAVGLTWWVAANERNAALRDLSRTAEALQSDLERELRITGVALDILGTAPSLDQALAGEPGGPGAEPFWKRSRALIDRTPSALHSIALFDLKGRPRSNTRAAGQRRARLRPVALPRHGAAAGPAASPISPKSCGRRKVCLAAVRRAAAGQPVIGIARLVRRDDRLVACSPPTSCRAAWARLLRQQLGGEQADHPVAAADRQGDADHRPPGQRPDEQRRDVAARAPRMRLK